jgi:hypothetical protein
MSKLQILCAVIYPLLEYWIGKTDKTKHNSLVSLLIGVAKSILKLGVK